MLRLLLSLLFLSVQYVAVSQQLPVPYTTASPQSSNDWQDAFRSWLSADDAAEGYSEATFELLSDLAEHPLNLNQTSQSELEQLPFLSAEQIEELVAYIERYRPLRSLSELQMIESLNRDTRLLLNYFVVIGDTLSPARSVKSVLSQMLHEGHFTLEGSLRQPFYKRKGDISGYLGYQQRHDLRLQFSSRDQLKFGLTAAQDAGEPFFSDRNRWGYDHYAYYFQLRKMGRLEALNLGMYRVQFGMGLVMNTGFYLGKQASLQSLGRKTQTLTAHTSRSVGGYLQGAAAQIRLAPAWSMTAFASYRPIDATLNDDGTIRTLLTDGYHRTPTEMAKKHNSHETDLGFRLSYQPNTPHKTYKPSISFNAVYTHFDRPLFPYVAVSQQHNYRLYAPSGSSFFNASLDYGLTSARFSFMGETAINGDGALAAIHTLSVRATDQLNLMLLHRYYDKRYTALHARSFGESSSAQNEHGVYLGASWSPSRKLLLQSYVDYAHFPFLRYRVNAPSDAFDAFFLARTLFNIGTLEAHYRFHIRQRNNTTQSYLNNHYEHRTRLSFTYPSSSSSPSVVTQPQPSLSFKTQLDAVLINCREQQTSRGIMISQQAVFRYRALRLNGFVGWFRSDNYDSRLYQYEPSIPYDFSFPAFYGHGIRYSLMARADLGRWSLSVKIGTTDYFDRAVISSGYQQINASSQTDLLLQFRLKL